MTTVRRAAITAAALAVLLLLLAAIPTHTTAPCRIAGHARTTVQECR